MPVFITKNAKNSPKVSKREIRGLAEKMLTGLGLEESELSVLLCNDAVIHELNKTHRGKDKPTDVLSFPQAEFVKPEKVKKPFTLNLLGDVVISLDTAQRQAESRRRSLICEVRFLLAHGLLHLLGHDHVELDEKALMTKRTKQLVKMAPIAD